MKPSTYERIPHREDHITIKTFEDYNSASLHWHEIIEILYYHDDRTYVDCNLEEIHTKNGDIIFVNMNELHKEGISIYISLYPSSYGFLFKSYRRKICGVQKSYP